MRHLARLAGLAILVPVMLTACSSPSSDKTASSSSTTAPAVSSSPSPAAPTPENGTQLAAALVADVPAGFVEVKANTVDTGTDTQAESSGPMKSRAHCADLEQTSWMTVAGMSGVAFAESDYQDKHDQEITQEVDAFSSPAVAARTMKQLKAFAESCTKFADAGSKSIIWHAAVSTAPKVGPGAFEAVLTSPNIYGGMVNVAVQQGDNVITTLYSARKLSTANESSDFAAGILKKLSAN